MKQLFFLLLFSFTATSVYLLTFSKDSPEKIVNSLASISSIIRTEELSMLSIKIQRECEKISINRSNTITIEQLLVLLEAYSKIINKIIIDMPESEAKIKIQKNLHQLGIIYEKYRDQFPGQPMEIEIY